jgi:hypothetical protein
VVILSIALSLKGYGQLIIVPIHKESSEKKKSASRNQSTDPVELPFWDDFSAARSGKINNKLWQYGESVWINDGMAINPPSLNVATFDGLDSLGKPYNVNDILAKGYADKLVSAPIRMDLVSEADRSRVFIGFFYQFHGNGEPPDEGDLISLSFKNSSGVWELIWSKENDGTLARDIFEQLTIPITDQRFFHDSFQFKIENFARLSGPYDTWHVDYIYLNNGKQQSNPVRPLFPDRTITSKLNSPYASYWSMPIKHYLSATTANSVKPTITITNLRQDQVAGNGQPVSYSSAARMSVNKKNEPPVITNIPLDNNLNIGSELTFLEHQVVSLNKVPDSLSYGNSPDSVNMKLSIIFDTGDNKTKTATEGDYDFAVFNPIEFRTNDSISATFVLSSYYAYDDGTAEYGAGLNQPGAQLAYQFDMKTDKRDTIVAIDIYFPRFGDDSNQVIDFQILRALTNDPSDILYRASMPIQRNTQNKFWRIPLVEEPVGVKGKFYLGWKQNSSAVIAVGLDKNTDSGDKIFANINGTWEPNINLHGSLMMRPVFGKGNGEGEVITGIENPFHKTSLYPNPAQGVIYISTLIDLAEVMDLTGRKIDIITEADNEQTRITIPDYNAGLYLLKIYSHGRWHSFKVILK